MSIERKFDVSFVSPLAAKEKQIQQNYRPYIGVHKWFARRPGSLFRSLLLAEFEEQGMLSEIYPKGNDLSGRTIADPFMGGGTILVEANRLGARVVGADINPMAYWVTRQELMPLNREAFRSASEEVLTSLEREIGRFYETTCTDCGNTKAEVKYFFWVKQQECANTKCRAVFDLFPGYLVAENSRHTHFVLHCPHCSKLVQVEDLPGKGKSIECPDCKKPFGPAGPATRNKYTCPECGHVGRYPSESRTRGVPQHRLFGIEYHCGSCRELHKGRYFKTPDERDLEMERLANRLLEERRDTLLIPEDIIPEGDETTRLHRWGYTRYNELFNSRQLIGLATLLSLIQAVPDPSIRQALATVFSDTLRYQNMLCRYDTYALKCQDIFAVHGFPVGLVQCENNLFGISGIGSGGFRHFIEKYDRAKAYCERPFETVWDSKGKKKTILTPGEHIEAQFISTIEQVGESRTAFLVAGSIEDINLPKNSLDGVFTDPPYFDNVQYAELMDFCFVWLRLLLNGDAPEFQQETTRTVRELTGNVTTGKGLAEFTSGLSNVYRSAAGGLKPNAPFVFTYHHNDLFSYVPLVVAILDANLLCNATLPCPGEMGASLHISGTGSSTLDTVFVCRSSDGRPGGNGGIPGLILWDDLHNDVAGLGKGLVFPTLGDLRCLAYGHLTRYSISRLRATWNVEEPLEARMDRARQELLELEAQVQLERVVKEISDGISRPAK